MARDDELAALAVDHAQLRLRRDDAFEAGIRSRGYCVAMPANVWCMHVLVNID